MSETESTDENSAIRLSATLGQIEAINSLEIQKYKLLLEQQRQKPKTQIMGRNIDFLVKPRRAA